MLAVPAYYTREPVEFTRESSMEQVKVIAARAATYLWGTILFGVSILAVGSLFAGLLLSL
jgi:hypothetical protein